MASRSSVAARAACPDPALHERPRQLSERVEREVFQRTLVLAAVAHELKTPLALLEGYTDFLLGNHAGPLTEKQQAVLSEMQQNTERLQRFVQSFLSFSALESGRVEANKEPGNINRCVAEVVKNWSSRFADRGTRLDVVVDPELPDTWFDCLKVQHVISNLLDNALKFAPEGGQVRISTGLHHWERRSVLQQLANAHERRTAEPQRSHNCVRIDVSDNGPGIAPEYHHEIFEEFLQLQPRAGVEGVGLGLAIARRLAEAHGGKIWVESSLGNGSTFSVLLPNS